MIEIIFLGTAGAVASKTRDNTSFLIKGSKDLILIDLPGSPVKKLAQVNLDFRKISCIFLTHAHPDHIYGIISLLHSQYKLGNIIHVFSHRKTINLVKLLRKIFKLEDTHIYPEVIYHEIKASLTKPFYNSDDFCVYAFRVKHSPESLGFRFNLKKIRKYCVLSGDTAVTPNLIKASPNCHYLIHDCFCPERFFIKYPQLNSSHTSSLSLGKIAKLSNVKVLIPIHFASEVRYSFKEIVREIKKNFSGKVIIPLDFQALELN